MTSRQWMDVPEGAIVRPNDGYEWKVEKIENGAVTLFREGRGSIVGHPTLTSLIEVVSMPPVDPAVMRAAVATLREQLGIEVLECGWCLDATPGDVEGVIIADSDCVCETHCGVTHCVNFRMPL